MVLRDGGDIAADANRPVQEELELEAGMVPNEAAAVVDTEAAAPVVGSKEAAVAAVEEHHKEYAKMPVLHTCFCLHAKRRRNGVAAAAAAAVGTGLAQEPEEVEGRTDQMGCRYHQHWHLLAAAVAIQKDYYFLEVMHTGWTAERQAPMQMLSVVGHTVMVKRSFQMDYFPLPPS